MVARLQHVVTAAMDRAGPGSRREATVWPRAHAQARGRAAPGAQRGREGATALATGRIELGERVTAAGRHGERPSADGLAACNVVRGIADDDHLVAGQLLASVLGGEGAGLARDPGPVDSLDAERAAGGEEAPQAVVFELESGSGREVAGEQQLTASSRAESASRPSRTLGRTWPPGEPRC
jgi:hypothetical protein